MSIEIRIVCTDAENCHIGLPKPIGEPWTCLHYMECDWGRIENSEADPRDGLKHLMLITGHCVERMLTSGPELSTCSPDHVCSCTRTDGRTYVHLDRNGGGDRTTWELFPCHFWDGKGPDDLLIGRWPD